MLVAMTVFLSLGLVTGLLAGLLGVGGGLVLVVGLVSVLPSLGIPAEAVMHTALASALAAILVTAFASARAHARRGGVLWSTIAWLVPGLLVGGWLGSSIAMRIDGDVLRFVVCGYCFLAALQLSFPRTTPEIADSAGSVPTGAPMTAAGIAIGAVSSVVGIGGGSMTVPLLVWRGVAPAKAVGTSSAGGVVIGLAGAAGYALLAPVGALPEYGIGYIYLPATIGVSIASVCSVPLGTRLAHRLRGVTLKRVFACFLVAVGVSLLLGG